jgi:hypothetical protein
MEQRTTGGRNEAVPLAPRLSPLSCGKTRERTSCCFLLDTRLSSTPLLANSTRHSVTSRIEPNSPLLSDLIFSTRQLNATPEKRQNVEKFNIWLRFVFAFGFTFFSGPSPCVRAKRERMLPCILDVPS